MKRAAFALLLLATLLSATLLAAGVTRISFGSSLPTNCVDGNVFVKTSATAGVYWCSTAGSPGTWTAVTDGVGTGTVTHTGSLTANLPVIGNGTADVTIGSASGNTTKFATVSGSLTSGNCLKSDASGNLVDNGSACGTGAGGGNVTDSSAFGSEPGSPSGGDLEFYNNSFYTARYSGSAWAPWGPIFPMTPPVDGDFSWVNQGGASVSTTNGGIYLSGPAGSGDNWRLRVKSAPSTPYVITAAFLASPVNINFCEVGIGFRESSSGKMATFFLQGNGGNIIAVSGKYTNPTTFSANYTTMNSRINAVVWMRIADDGTNRIASISADGQNWTTFHSVGRTDFLTADQVFFGLNANNATWAIAMTLISWKES